MAKRTFSIGEKFNRLTIIDTVTEPVGNKGRVVLNCICKCDCGNITKTTITRLRSGKTKSCGCWNDEVRRTHGMNKTPEHNTWIKMKQRCLNPNDNAYHLYGGRGITVCKRWLKFENFYKDMGDRPDGASLDRINNNKGYCKSNCRWATWTQQANNRRDNIFLTLNGERKTVANWARHLDIPYTTIMGRLKRNLSIKDVLSKERVERRGQHAEVI